MKKILIIGGTAFIGRVLVEKLMENKDYEVTLFHRGKTNPGLFPELMHIHGDRDTNDVQLLAKGNWDAVVDISGYFPDSIEKMADALKGHASRYVFISTVSVYPLANKNHKVAWTEEDKILACTPEQRIAPRMEAYGEKKAECERCLLAREWIDTVILRPALVFGRYDYTDRLYYWLHKVWKDEPFLLPNLGRDAISYTYVDDLAQAIISAIETPAHRWVYNLSTHPVVSFAEFVQEAASVLGKSPKLIGATANLMERYEIKPWTDLPLWSDGGAFTSDNSKAIKDLNLQPTPLPQAVAATLAWYESLGWPEPMAGMTQDKENEVISQLAG